MAEVEIRGSRIGIEYGNKVTVVMLSGGYASTYALYKILKETDDIVIAHHVHLPDHTYRSVAEAQRCKEIVIWCRRRVRDFAYSETAVDLKGLQGPDDPDPAQREIAVAFESGIVTRSFCIKYKRTVDRVIYGRRPADENRPALMAKACRAASFPFKTPEIEFPFTPTAEACLVTLPLKLHGFCWSCETPVLKAGDTFDPCGDCVSCRGEEAKRTDRSPATITRPKARNSASVTLVMLSGGIDSVYVLEKLLRNTKDTIIAHHVHMVNDEQRYKVEAERCTEIVKWCRTHIRDFDYSETTVDHRGMFSMGFDILNVGFQAGIVNRTHAYNTGIPITRWTSGWCEEEEAVPGRAPHIETACAAASHPTTAPDYFHLPVIPKADQMRAMTPALLDLCWTCRRPIWQDDGSFEECGTCHTCELMAEVAKELHP